MLLWGMVVSFFIFPSTIKERKLTSNCPVNTVLNVAKDGDKHGDQKDDGLNRLHSPEHIQLSRRRHQVCHSVDDNRRQTRHRDEVESIGQSIERKKHQDTSNDTCRGSAHTRF